MSQRWAYEEREAFLERIEELVTGGKPLISIPPFVIIGFALTILLGALASFAGFLFLARVPSVQGIRGPEEHDNRFVILLRDEGPS